MPYGMIKPTLFDVEATSGLRTTSKVFDPTVMDEDTIDFDKKRISFAKFINYYHDTTIGEVSDKEYITFFTMWLSRFVF